MEMLDVLDENGELTGQKEERRVIHEKSLWHYHVGVWIMNQKGELLFQKRSSNKKVNPNRWTRTGGHVDSGETPLQGIQREVQEEIGVKIPLNDFKLINIRKHPSEYGKNFTYNYFAIVNYKIEEYTMQKEEVSALKYVTIEEIEDAYKRYDKSYTFVEWKNFDDVLKDLKNRRKEMMNQ